MLKILVALLAILALTTPAQAIGWEGFHYPTEHTNKIDSFEPDGATEDEVEPFHYPSEEYDRGYLDVKPEDAGIPPEFEDRGLPKIDLGQ